MLSISSLYFSLTKLRFDLFREMELMLVAQDERTACVWRACDPYTTESVRGVEGHGYRLFLR